MRTKLPTRIDVVKKEEKEAHLIAFIRADLEAARTRAALAPDRFAGREYTLVLRSLQSPVARALATLSSDLAAGAVTLRLVMVQPILGADTGLATGDGADLAPILLAARVLRDIRFLDAHEQLCLGDANTWFGDCMRREPGKRDAYECYAADNPDLARWAATSFERLWAQGEPVARAEPTVGAALDDAELCGAALAQAEAANAVEAATRH